MTNLILKYETKEVNDEIVMNRITLQYDEHHQVITDNIDEVFKEMEIAARHDTVYVFVESLKQTFFCLLYRLPKEMNYIDNVTSDSAQVYNYIATKDDIISFIIKFKKTHHKIVFKGLDQYKNAPLTFEFINRANELFPKIFKAATISSYAIKSLIGSGYGSKAFFRNDYPIITGKERTALESLRESSCIRGFGGVRYGVFGEHKGALKFDKNSMYPSILLKKLFPKGRGRYVEDPRTPKDKSTNIRLLHIKNLDIELPINILPTSDSEYWRVDDIWLFDFLYEYLMKRATYKACEPQVVEAYEYNAGCLNGWSKDTINKWYNQKEELKGKDDLGRLLTKLILNSCYGKFGQKIIISKYTIDRTEEGVFRFKEEKLAKPQYGAYEYLPISECIIQYAWLDMMKVAFEFDAESVLYMDTDCIVLKDTEDVRNRIKKSLYLRVGKKIGEFKLENELSDFVVHKMKQYAGVDKNTGEFIQAHAGLGEFESFDGMDTFNQDTTIRTIEYKRGGAIFKEETRTSYNEVSLKIDNSEKFNYTNNVKIDDEIRNTVKEHFNFINGLKQMLKERGVIQDGRKR